MIKSVNPSTGNLIKEYNTYSTKEILSIIDEVSEEYHIWKDISYKDRSKILLDILLLEGQDNAYDIGIFIS